MMIATALRATVEIILTIAENIRNLLPTPVACRHGSGRQLPAGLPRSPMSKLDLLQCSAPVLPALTREHLPGSARQERGT
jgi:hypothetical protein